MEEKSIIALFKRFKKQNPKPTTELIYHSPFELLIAVILSAQATDKSVNKATIPLFKVANTPEKIAALQVSGLMPYIKTIGLYKNKAKYIIATCELLIHKFNHQVPSDREELESLPGVGRKTANVILNTCFHKPVIAVDTHIFRVARRIGLSHAKTPLTVELELEKKIPKPFLLNAHHWLILHGRYVCTARAPHCRECIVLDLCTYTQKNL